MKDNDMKDNDKCLLENQDIYLGEGFCRKANGGSPLYLSTIFENSDMCREKCCQYSDWCLASEFVEPFRECKLISDIKTLDESDQTLENKYQGGITEIDGVSYSLSCTGTGFGCTEGGTAFEGGSFEASPERHCWLSSSVKADEKCLSTEPDSFLGDGECRGESGQYTLKFSLAGSNEEWCRKKCCGYDWCHAAQFSSSHRDCHLVTDLASFKNAGYDFTGTSWAADQVIDGQTYTTYCGGDGTCTEGNTEYGQGSLNPRPGYKCWRSGS